MAMNGRIEIDPTDPAGKTFIGRNDYGDDIKNLTAALHDLIHQIRNQPADTPATFDRRVRFIDTITYANAENTYFHYLPRLLSMSEISPNA